MARLVRAIHVLGDTHRAIIRFPQCVIARSGATKQSRAACSAPAALDCFPPLWSLAMTAKVETGKLRLGTTKHRASGEQNHVAHIPLRPARHEGRDRGRRRLLAEIRR